MVFTPLIRKNFYSIIKSKKKSLNNPFTIALQIIKEFEGLSLKAYKCPAGVWTIGYGNTSYLKSFTNPTSQIIRNQKADELLQQDIKIYLDAVTKQVGSICNDNQIGALTSFCFNVGVTNFNRSTLLKVIKVTPKDFLLVQKEFMKWVYGGGKILPGLVRRRKRESDVYCE